MANAVVEDRVWSFRDNNYLSSAAFTLLYYDYVLSFTDEVNYFWKSASLSLFSTLFVFNRYLGLLGTIPVIVEYFGDLPETIYHQAFSIVLQGIIASMLLLRTYALYERNKAILALLVVTYIGSAAACLVAMLIARSHAELDASSMLARDPPNQCNLSLTTIQGIYFSISWGAMLWFDTTVFVLTLIRALRMHQSWLSGGTLEVLFRDASGTIYFGRVDHRYNMIPSNLIVWGDSIMVVLNVSNIVTFLATAEGSKKGMETTLVNVLSTTLASRLFLNLRDLTSPHSIWHGDEDTSVTRYWDLDAGRSAVQTISLLVFATQTGGSINSEVIAT